MRGPLDARPVTGWVRHGRWSSTRHAARPLAQHVQRVALMAVLLGGTASGWLRADMRRCAGLLNPQEEALASLFESARGQRRRQPSCDPTLSAVARARAFDMAERGYFAHVTPEGEGANRIVSRAGYALPDYYGTQESANNIEVIASGEATAEEAWQLWMDSSRHKAQVLGTKAFYREQSDYGVGFAEVKGSRYRFYWVLISARR